MSGKNGDDDDIPVDEMKTSLRGRTLFKSVAFYVIPPSLPPKGSRFEPANAEEVENAPAYYNGLLLCDLPLKILRERERERERGNRQASFMTI